jgi:hypothetical protein
MQFLSQNAIGHAGALLPFQLERTRKEFKTAIYLWVAATTRKSLVIEIYKRLAEALAGK